MTSSVFIHRKRDLRVVTHVDDFLVAGEDHHLKWLREELAKKYELKVQVAGWQPGDDREWSFIEGLFACPVLALSSRATINMCMDSSKSGTCRSVQCGQHPLC